MRPITDILREIRGGDFVNSASDKLAELVKAVGATQKGGDITIKLKVKPDGEGAFTVVADCSTTVPKPDVAKTATFFSDVDGNLVRSDPRQADMLAERREERHAAAGSA